MPDKEEGPSVGHLFTSLNLVSSFLSQWWTRATTKAAEVEPPRLSVGLQLLSKRKDEELDLSLSLVLSLEFQSQHLEGGI